MESSKSVIHLYLFVAAIFILGGCTTKIHFDLPELAPEYSKLEAPIPLRVALIVPEKTREFAYKIPLKHWCLGEAVPGHMGNGLRAAFKDVVTVVNGEAPADVDRVMICSLGDKTDLKAGVFVWSDKTTIIELNCQVSDNAKSVLWEGYVLRTDTFNPGIAGYMLPITALASNFLPKMDVRGAEAMYADTITSAANNCLILAVDQFMEKMLREGRSKICPGCNDATDWRKTVSPVKSDTIENDEN
ncbi:MAG: hypothetical protein Q7W05_15655 [Deltaproteobacteria bacterium]|nr:hypothetical protein [Deltaproteobacteria bacterium]